MNKARIDIEFEFGHIDGRHMTVQIGDQTICPNDPTISFEISLPASFDITYSGKNNQTDTKLDESGQIIADMYVKIKTMKLDGFPMSPKYLYQRLVMHTEAGESFTTCYAGFNGHMHVDLDQPTVFSQYVLMNS
jgi:hypothetical protein